MATTPNYGFIMPDPTDFVTDLPADFEIFGDEVDSRIKALNPSTTLGDIEYRSSTANTNDRLPIGSTGDVLTVTGGVPVWAAPGGAGENYSLINAGGTNLTAATSITVSGISGKKGLLIYIEAGSADALSFFELIFNSDTASNYTFLGSRSVANAAYTNYTSIDYTQIDLARQDNNAATTVSAVLQLRGCDSTGYKPFVLNSGASANGTSGQNFSGSGYYKGTSAISSVTIRSTAGNFDAGKIYVYGA
jgi:hypothetical protein